MSRIDHLKEINDFLTHFAMTLESENSNGEFSKNRHAEDIFLPILEYVIGKKLMNVNSLNGVSNYPAIDLISEDGKIGVQVTSTGAKRKIIRTLKTYAQTPNLILDEIYIFIISEKEKIRTLGQAEIKEIFTSNIYFEPSKHVLDRKDLYKKISSFRDEDVERIYQKISNHFSKINTYKREQPDKFIAVSFEDKDIEFVYKVVSELLTKQVMIYSNSEKLEDQLSKHKFNDLFKLTRAKDIPEQVEQCIIFLTKNYYESKLRTGNECEIVQRIYNRGDQLIPILYEERLGKIKKFDLGKKSILIKGLDFDKTIKRISQLLHEYISKFEDYKDIASILSRFRADIMKIDSHYEAKENIGYQLFAEPNSIVENKIETFYLYLFKGAALAKTAEHFRLKYQKTTSNQQTPIAVLIPREQRLKKENIRKENVKDEFKAAKVYFLDEFLLEKCSPPEFKLKTEKFEIGEFVEPYIKQVEDRDDSGFINDSETEIEKWIDFSNAPVMVLTGAGGIGKTTLAKHIANCYLNTYSSSRAVFIQSDKVVSAINRALEREDDEIDIYKFYEASVSNESVVSMMDKDIFRYNFDNGNIILIIDGIDEIFSRVKQFNLRYFLSSIKSYLSGIGHGKILITCRDIWWDYIDLEKDDFSFMIMYEMCQFDNTLAKRYFEKKGIYNEKEISKLLDYARKISDNSPKEEFLPFVLHLLSNVYETEKENTFIHNFDSRILLPSDKVDIIINGICKREEKKQRQVCVDEQVDFFMHLAFVLHGSVSKKEFNKVLSSVLNGISQENINAFLAHPLLITSNDHIIFRYDFLKDHFRYLKISALLEESEIKAITKELIDSLASEGRYSSSLVKECAKRITTRCDGNDSMWEEFFYYTLSLIDDLSEQLLNTNHKRNIQKAISTLLTIALRAYHNKYGVTSEINTKVIKNILGKKNIKNLYVFDNLNGEKITFDFSDLKISNSGFIEYDRFFECKFNDTTFFDKTCTIRNIYTDKPNKSTAKSINFDIDMPDSDESIPDFLRAQKGNRLDLRKKASDTIEEILGFFFHKGSFKSCSVEMLKPMYERRSKVRFSYDDMIDFLQENNVILRSNKKQHEAYELQPEWKFDTESFITEGNPSSKINKLISDFLEELKT